jgi:hypothetical protein
MGNCLHHAKSSVKRWKGSVGDYLPIHELLDSPKSTMNNNTGRMMTHNTWFAYTIIPKIFGYNIINSDGKSVDTVDIAMLHIAEDFRYQIPTPQDFLKHMEVQAWMNNGVKPIPSQEGKAIVTDLLERLREDRQEVETI